MFPFYYKWVLNERERERERERQRERQTVRERERETDRERERERFNLCILVKSSRVFKQQQTKEKNL